MNNFKTIYKILKILDKNKGNEDFDISQISAEAMKVEFREWEQLMIELAENGYIRGVTYDRTMSDTFPHIDSIEAPRISLLGMEYLAENSMMAKAKEALMAIGEII